MVFNNSLRPPDWGYDPLTIKSFDLPVSTPSAALAALGWFTLTRLVIVAIGFIGVATFVDHHSLRIEGPAALSLEAVWHKWDALWYERIAVHGYGYQLDTLQGQAAAAFFPLFPLTVGFLLSALPFASFFWTGSIFSAACTLAASTLVARQLATDLGQAHRILMVLLASAGSFYFTLPYTEGLFLLLVVVTMVLTRRRQYALAGLVAGLAAVTRVQGLALVAVPVLACWLDDGAGSRGRRVGRIVAAATLFAVPIGAYLALLADAQGSAQAFVDRQAMWNNPLPYPFRAILGLIEFPRRVQAYLHGGTWLLYVALALRYARRLPAGEVLFCLGALVISTQQESFHGIYRYTAVLVPLALGIADDRREIRAAVIAINILFGTIMILAFVTHNRLAV